MPNRDHQPGHAGPADGRREARLADRPQGLDYLRDFGPEQLNSTYAIALQTMVFAAAEPERDQLRIAANVSWLESAQIKAGEIRVPWPGSWTYSSSKRPSPATTRTPSTRCWA